MNKNKSPKLPEEIKVTVSHGQSGCYLADLPELDIFTEADTLPELFNNVNDLIYTFFEVPKKVQENVWYLPPLAVREGYAEMEKKKAPGKIAIKAFYSSEFSTMSA